ncbi:hypothetical protein KUTeg_020705 [Tegillarca granosa]|uniref:Major facilitator superfamily domain-containing protein 4A n=1 Tax=Tegillarca granosa TaxID=220873 RepID=A0ABQ9E8Q8_TEGGR|nr:hypothetical protein KUTeg_020705 [Tegillarca granosa]
MAEGEKGSNLNPGDGEPRQHPKEIINALQRSDSSETEQVSFWKLLKGNWLSVTMDCLVFGSFGMGVAFLGPTLFDLGCQTNSSLKEMNWVFFVQLIMTLVGSISAGCLADRMVPVHVLLLIGMVGLPITMFFIPMCTAFAALLIDLMLMGWCMGCIDCVTNLRMILRFGVNVSPFLQAMYFFYGLGAFVSPMIAAPFVLNVDCSPFIEGVTQETVTETGKQTISISPSPQKVTRSQHLSHAKIAFAILGGIQLLISIIVVAVIILEKKRIIGTGVSVSQSSSAHSIFSETGKHFEQGRCFTCGTREVVIITFITSLSLFIYDGVQSSFADFIYSYAEKNIDGLERSEGAVLNACFWGLFAFGRLIAVPWATRCNPEFMLLVNLSGSTLTLLITLIWRTHHTVIYIGACFIGFFISSLSPSVMSLTEQYIDINRKYIYTNI